MPHDQDRIRLAEAIGGPIWEAYIDPGEHPECVELPDPFINANDDYAVLEWLLSQGIFRMHPQGDYKIGDYARAALKVLGEMNGAD